LFALLKQRLLGAAGRRRYRGGTKNTPVEVRVANRLYLWLNWQITARLRGSHDHLLGALLVVSAAAILSAAALPIRTQSGTPIPL
jgi:hypothetical protein